MNSPKIEGTLRISAGTIYGSNEDEGIRNTATEGAALYVESGSMAQRGTFSGSTWNSKGDDLSTTDDTIIVEGGVLQ